MKSKEQPMWSRRWMAWGAVLLGVVLGGTGARADDVDSDGDGLSDAWERGEGRYELVSWTNGWTAAKADAEARGGHLATITSEAEWLEVIQRFGTNLVHCWLGGTDEEEEGVWKWVTGEKWKLTKWRIGEPNNSANADGSTEHYLEIGHESSGYIWNDAGEYRDVIVHYLLEYGFYTDPANADTDGDGVNDGKEYELGWLPNLNDRDGTGNRVVAVSALQRTLGKGVVDIEYEIEGNAVDEEWLEVELVADVIVNGTALRIGALSGEVTAAAGVHQMTWDSGADWPGLDAGNVVIRLTIMPKMSELWHVSPTGDDHADGKSWATAKKTLQTVVEEAVDGETILVAPGTYGAIAPGNKSITIRGVGGAEETILDGGGSACVVLCEGSNPVMIGLTLQNGYAVGGGGANHGTFHNCIIRDNVARDDGGGVWKSICHSCLITGNYATDSGGGSCGGGAYGSKLYNCTVVGNRCFNQTNSQWGAGIAWCLAYNCIIYNNTLDSGVINNYTKSTNYYTCTTPKASGTGNITNAPLFVDAIHGDYRLERISPCINAGSNGYVAVLTDLAGNQRIASTVDMGAFECGAVGVYSPVNVPSEYVVSGAKASAIAVYTRDSDEDGLYDAWERGEGRYEVVEFEGTWEEARADAEARGGHLATITSEAEWVAISNLFGAKLDGCWLGGSDEEEEGVWTWVTGEPWAYTRWDSGQPDNKFSTQDYLAIQNNLNWDDGVMDLVGQKYLFEFGVYTDPLNEDTDGDGVPDGEEYELGRSPVVNEADGTANEIVSVVCRQRWPWNGLVDIDYEISGWGTNEADFVVVLQGTATIGEQTVELRTLSGEVTAAAGWHRMTWDSTVDWGEDEVAEATVKLEIVTPYLSVDMSGGKDASNWPITPMKNIPEGGWTTDDKTTRMVLRRIEAGTFMMGSPEAEQGRMSTREDLRSVTLTKPYYIGVFEVTQRQWELAMGSNPSQYTGDARPVERVNYNMIRGTSRGAFWPENGAYSPAYAVDGTSFVWKVRTETGLMLDLPTEAQWERACRAGTQSALYSGQELTALDTCSNVAAIARYAGNISEGTGGYGEGHTMVGSFDPNGWGLYDMNGNVWEVCLDWYAESLGTEAAMDPLGPTNGTMRTYRGGSWHDQASACRSATRSATLPTKIGDNDGLRLVCPAGTQSSVESVAFTLDGRAGREVFAGVVGIGVDGVTWSSEWEDGGTGARALVSEDGVAMWSEIGEGSGTWTPLTAGTRELTHQVWLEGTTVGETLRATFEITKGDQSIVFPAIGVQWATNEVTLGARASSGLNVAYEVTSGPGVVENGMLRFTGPGVVTVTARQEGDDNWNAAVAVSSVATVRVVPTEVVLSDLVQTFNGEGRVVTVETVPEGVTVRVTYDGEEEAPVHAGDYAVRVETADARFTGSVDGVLRVAKASQGIVFSPVGSPAWTNRVTLGATAQSGLGVSYTVVSGPGSVSGNVLTFSGPGLVRVEASQAGNEDWEAAESVTLDVEVVKATARVSIGDLEQVYDRETKGVSTGTIPEGLRVLVTYDGTDEAPVGAGSYAVVATVEDTKWEGSATGTLVVAKGSQSIAFDEIGAQGVTNVVALGAAASSGLAMEYVVEGPAVLGEGNVLTFTGVGTVSVTAKQEGDGNWEAAEPVVRVFEVSKGVAVVTLSGLEQVYDGSARVVEAATVPEGLEVEVRYEGSEVAPTNAGRYAVEAVVVDKAWGGRAEGVLVVAKGSQFIEFAEIGSCGVAERLDLVASASSGLGVTFAVLSGPAILEGGASLRFAETGRVEVAAMQFGDDNWLAAETARQAFDVVKSQAEVRLEGLEQVYDGGARVVGASTVPEGLAVRVTYEGGEAAPTNAGRYAVAAVVEDAKWEGRAEGVLVVAKGRQVIEFPEIGEQVLTNRVELGATASSGLAVRYEVVEGPGTVDGAVLSFSGVGSVTVAASQAGDDNWEAAEEVRRVVEVSGALRLAVECAHGTAEPGVGEHEVMIGSEVVARVEGSPAAIGEGWRAVCTGWRLEGNEPGAGEGLEARFVLTNSATLTWVWETQALVRAEGLAHGTAEGGGWYAVGSTATLTAVPEEGHPFTGWEGDFGTSRANPWEVAVRGPGLSVATFFTTFYAREDGDDAADGLSRATAKREISAALALAAWGDEVVAGAGTYGAVSVPEGVSVFGEEGAEATTIRGGSGVRCVEAAEGAVVGGFSLTGGEVEGNGGGALLADGAELRRCILQGNQAGGLGGGAFGGVLENCLLSGNGAAAGGGAANAVLRHCTVVRSTGGGAKDCRTVNSVFWDNDGGDVEGGTTGWSLCNPVAAGQGNIEGDPRFAREAGWRLAYESPCVNAAGESGVAVDLAGAPRPQPKVYGEAARADMGCYEYVPKARFVWTEGRGVPPYESWQDAARDIQSAIDISGSGDRVVVEAGTYGAFSTSNAVVVMGLRGAGQTVIDAGGNERAVTMSGGGVLEGFTVRGGASEDCGGILADGGATVRDVVVEDCRATGAEGCGGGVCLYGGSVAENVTASGNQAAYGAGVWATATSGVVRCELAGNVASAWGGGAWLGDESRMEGCAVEGNSAVRGGGVYGEDCEIADCTLTNNAATGAGGGAAAVRSTFRNNVVRGNRAASGGGLWAQDTDGHDCLVAGNEAGRGAGVWAEGEGGLWNFTVADNGGTGTGVAAQGTTVLGNSIVWGNAGGNVDAADGVEVRYSCSAPVAGGAGNFAEEPRFAGEGDYHLRAGSPCVDAGEVREWMVEAYDFDGQRRVEVEGEGRDSWVDVGVDEAAQDAVGAPSGAGGSWTWRVVPDARLQLQRTPGLTGAAAWEAAGEAFTATNGVWTLEEPFEGTGTRFYRLIWWKE